MKKIFLTAGLWLAYSMVFAQKPEIDFNMIDKFPNLGVGKVSYDGNYFLAQIKIGQNSTSGISSSTLMIQSIKNGWKKEIPNCSEVNFSAGSNFAVFKGKKDSLGILTLGTDNLNYITNVRSYKLPTEGSKDWLVYQFKSPNDELNVVDLKTGRRRIFSSVSKYFFCDEGNALIIGKKNADQTESLDWIELTTNQEKVIWQGNTLGFGFAVQEDHLAFFAKKPSSDDLEIWYYKKGIVGAVNVSDAGLRSVDKTLAIQDEELIFSKHGDKLFFKLIEKFKPKQASGIQVDVWGYADKKIQSEQWYDRPQNPHSYFAAIDLSNKDNSGSITNKRLIQLESESENILLTIEDLAEFTGDHILIGNHREYLKDSWWSLKEIGQDIFTVSLIDGSRMMIKSHTLMANGFNFPPSPSGRYFVYFDPVSKMYFSYDVVTQYTRNITKSIKTRLDNEMWYDQPSASNSLPVDVAGWVEQDNAVLIYDNYDIWEVELTGNHQPINLTKGYGIKQHIKFRILNGKATDNYQLGEKIILSAFNTVTKYAGFYEISLGQSRLPTFLSMGPYAYGGAGKDALHGSIFSTPNQEIKAKNSGTWVVHRMSFNKFPNYFSTSDFKSFHVLTDIQPQQNYNWMTKELVRWKSPDGSLLSGILYKPENFDPKKKYPLLVGYYDKLSGGLFKYDNAAYSDGSLSEPYFISRGYLLFTPDIHFKTGYPGESVLNSVISGVKYLHRYSWVDFNRMGLFGVSFSGFLTNYIVTHSHLFKAAVECCGVSDIISHTGYLMNGYSANGWTELGQLRMGASLWERPDLYISNSPIFKADQITTPLLIMNNKGDEGTNFSQGLAMYMAMRRLKKPGWLLQYDKGVHGLGGEDMKDFTIRLLQFYDHYLKDAPPPKWMTEGIPMRFKGIETGYELDNSGKKP